MIMSKDPFEGKSKMLAGKMQENVGRLFNSKKQQIRGSDLQIAGSYQKNKGNIKHAFDDWSDTEGNN